MTGATDPKAPTKYARGEGMRFKEPYDISCGRCGVALLTNRAWVGSWSLTADLYTFVPGGSEEPVVHVCDQPPDGVFIELTRTNTLSR